MATILPTFLSSHPAACVPQRYDYLLIHVELADHGRGTFMRTELVLAILSALLLRERAWRRCLMRPPEGRQDRWEEMKMLRMWYQRRDDSSDMTLFDRGGDVVASRHL